MARFKRDYLQEAHYLGRTYKQIGAELGISKSTARRWTLGISESKASYEQGRNVFRKASYSYMKEAGYPSKQARASRRMVWTEFEDKKDWMDGMVGEFAARWHITKEEARERIQEGLRRGKTQEDIERY